MTEPMQSGPALIDKRLTLRRVGGQALVLRQPAVCWQRRLDGSCQITLSFTVLKKDYDRIVAGQLFALYPELCGASFGGRFLVDRSVEIEAGLAADLCARFASVRDAKDVATAIRQAAWNDPLRFVDNYFATHVKQTLLPGVKRGYTTRWAHEFAAGGTRQC